MSYVATPSCGVETCDISDYALISNHDHFWDYLASHAGVFRGARFSSPSFVGRDEKQAPLKTPAWEARDYPTGFFVGF